MREGENKGLRSLVFRLPPFRGVKDQGPYERGLKSLVLAPPIAHTRDMNKPKPTDWTDPKWSLPNVHVSASWGGAQSVEGK